MMAAALWMALGSGGGSSLGGLVGLNATNPIEVYTVSARSFPVLVRAKGELKAKKTTEIKCLVEGRTTILWLIPEGTQVKKGDLLVRLASDKIEERLRQEEAKEASAIAALEAAEKDLEILIDKNKSDIQKADVKLALAKLDREKYIKGEAEKALMEATLDVDRAEQLLERAKLDFKATDELFKKHWRTKSQWLQAQFDMHEAERGVEKAKLSKHILITYTQPRDLKQKDSDVQQAEEELARVKKSAKAKESQKQADVEAKRANLINTQTNLKKLRDQLELCEIHAPTPGLVVYDTGSRWDRRQIGEGTEVYEQQTIVQLPDPSVMIVTTRIHEAKTSQLSLGQRTRITVDGLPDRTFTGKVSKIAPLADSRNAWLNPDLKEYDTEITLDHTDANLKPGMTARVLIVVTDLKEVLAVPLQAVISKAGHHFVFVPNSSEPKAVEVTLGSSSTEYVEIVKGVTPGMGVLLSLPDNASRFLPDLPAPPGEASFFKTAAKAARPNSGKRSMRRKPPSKNAKTSKAARSHRGGHSGRTRKANR